MSVSRQVEEMLTRLGGVESFLPTATPWVLGVSGGPDSLALLHILHHRYPDGELIVAHLNHRLRPTAVSEAKFVRDTAVSMGRPFHQQSIDVPALARQEGFSIEEAARVARYRFLAGVARQNEADTIAVGHNADDQAETVLMNLLRGSGLAGLRGMQPLGPVPGAPDLQLVRPLLAVSRADILAYCQANRLQPVDDASNRDLIYRRNRIRHRLLPALEKYNPNLRQRLWTLAVVTAADYELLEQLAEETWNEIQTDRGEGWVRLDRAAWAEQPLSLRRRLLRRAVRGLAPRAEIGFETIEAARRLAEEKGSGENASLPGGCRLRVGYEVLEVRLADTAVPPENPQLPAVQSYNLSIPGILPLADGWYLSATPATEVKPAQVQKNRDPWRAFVDVGQRETVQVRPRQPGERFQPLGMSGYHASLQDLMINRQIDAHLRPRWPLVAVPEHLIWVVGHQLDRRARVREETERIILLECRRDLSRRKKGALLG